VYRYVLKVNISFLLREKIRY